jgi:eukaryotic-like serine/threonine-protein kinase
VTATRLDDRYVLGDEIAAGGMATIHLGTHIGPAGFRRTVAIKRLHARTTRDRDFVRMLLDEARLAARIQHTNVVPTLEVVEREDELFVVMDYVPGESVSHLIRATKGRSETIPIPIVVAIIVGALHGLHAAHEAMTDTGEALGIVHRDVSPQNILVGVDGVARVLDFGVAKAIGRLSSTSEGQVKGKAAYMSPEQVRGESVDRATDVFAAAVVLHEMLTLERLFAAESPTESMARVLAGRVRPPSSVAPSAPPALDAVVLRALAPDRDARYSTALAFAAALEEAVTPATPRVVAQWVERLSGDALSKRKALVASLSSHSQIATAVEGPRATRPRAPFVTITAAVLAIGVGVFAWRRSHQDPPTSRAPQASSSTPVVVSAEIATTVLAEPAPLPSVTASVHAAAVIARPHAPSATASAVQQPCGYRMFVDDAGLLKPRWTCP